VPLSDAIGLHPPTSYERVRRTDARKRWRSSHVRRLVSVFASRRSPVRDRLAPLENALLSGVFGLITEWPLGLSRRLGIKRPSVRTPRASRPFRDHAVTPTISMSCRRAASGLGPGAKLSRAEHSRALARAGHSPRCETRLTTLSRKHIVASPSTELVYRTRMRRAPAPLATQLRLSPDAGPTAGGATSKRIPRHAQSTSRLTMPDSQDLRSPRQHPPAGGVPGCQPRSQSSRPSRRFDG
jgi:hypothetical protein